MFCLQGGTGKCEALFDFEGDSGELNFVTGEMITILGKVDQDWMKGRIGTREGIFPVSFVKVITEIATVSPIKAPLKQGAASLGMATPPWHKRRQHLQKQHTPGPPTSFPFVPMHASASSMFFFEELLQL